MEMDWRGKVRCLKELRKSFWMVGNLIQVKENKKKVKNNVKGVAKHHQQALAIKKEKINAFNAHTKSLNFIKTQR